MHPGTCSAETRISGLSSGEGGERRKPAVHHLTLDIWIFPGTPVWSGFLAHHSRMTMAFGKDEDLEFQLFSRNRAISRR